MRLLKSVTYVDVYRAKASAKDINELSGRSGRPDLTSFVANSIVSKLPLLPETILVDVGCGDGSVLKAAAACGVDAYRGRLIGLLPSTEEVSRVRADLLERRARQPASPISIELGLANETHLPNEYVDVLVCNGVLLLLEDEQAVIDALKEFHRVAKPGGYVYIGELPDSSERPSGAESDSIVARIADQLKLHGPRGLLIQLRKRMVSAIGGQTVVLAPKKMFHMAPSDFIPLSQRLGFDISAHHRHKTLDTDGSITDSPTRWDYLLRKV